MRMQGIRTTSVNEQFVQERRDLIVKNALKLFVRKGMERTSMKDIGKACNMTSANLYNYIGKKEDLVTLVIQTTYSQLYKSLHEMDDYADTLDPTEALVIVIDRLFRVYDKYRDNTYFVTSDFISLKPSLRLTVTEASTNVAAMFEKIIKRGCAQGEFVAEDTWLAAHSIMTLALVWCLQYLVYSKRYSIDQYIKLQTEHVLHLLNCDAKVRASGTR